MEPHNSIFAKIRGARFAPPMGAMPPPYSKPGQRRARTEKKAEGKTVVGEGPGGITARLRFKAPWLEKCVRQDCDISHSELVTTSRPPAKRVTG